MNITTSIKRTLLRSPLFLQLFNSYRARTRKIYKTHSHLFVNKCGLEIGGPSGVFKASGPFPIYHTLASLDNVNFSSHNFWSTISEGKNFCYQEGKPNGHQIIADAVDLSKIPNESYDVLLASHVIEHIANPLKALNEWRRVIKDEGYIIIIAPDMRYTYDRKRPLTTLEHIVSDFKNDMNENDKSHLQEIIDLHDLSNDGTVATFEEHKRRTLDNETTRIAHHHTFDLNLVQSMLEHANFQIIDLEAFRPYHLLAIARKTGDIEQTSTHGI